MPIAQYGSEVNRFRGTVTISVPLPADEAMQLFTARGERDRVEGWDPEFPAGELDDFAAGFEKEIAAWELAIETALADRTR
jgi:hypothetical protein